MMKTVRTLFKCITALCLAAALALGSTALAAEIEAVQARQEDLDDLYEGLKDAHPDLFANTPEFVFLARKAEIESRLSEVGDVAFLLDLQSLAALVGDSHTLVPMGAITRSARFFPLNFTWMDGRWYLTAVESSHEELLGMEVTAVNGRSMAQVMDAFSVLLSADNPVRLRRQFCQANYVAQLYDYTGLIPLGQPMTLTLSVEAGQRTLTVEAVEYGELREMDLSSLSGRRADTAPTDVRKKYYFSQALNSEIYYIQYNTCREDAEIPMETFAAQVRSDLEQGAYRRILVDLRNNGGGSDGVIWPLLSVLRQAMDKGTEVVGLIGETTFSSAIINAVELQEMGAVLVGESASGSVDHFGAAHSFTLPNSGLQVNVSSKFIDLGTVLDADAGRGVEALEPDITVPQTLKDYLAGRDSCVQWLAAHPERLSPREYPTAPLTRGRFLAALYEAAGAPAQDTAQPAFDDSLGGIEWYQPALTWGKAAGIARGTGENCFAAIRPVTWQEAAAFLTRTAAALGLEPEAIRTQPLPGELARGAWDLEALELAWRWGLLPADADFTLSPTRAQGQAMAAALTALADWAD